MTVGSVPIGTDEYVLERASKLVRDRRADHIACCLDNMSDKQAAVLIAIESPRQTTSYGERTLDTGLSLEACRRVQTTGRSGRTKKSSSSTSSEGTVILPGGVPRESADYEPSPASPSTSFHESERVRDAVDGGKANVCLHWKQSGNLPEVIADLTAPSRDRVRTGLPESNVFA